MKLTNMERIKRIEKTTTHIYDANSGECDGVDLPEEDFDWLVKQAKLAESYKDSLREIDNHIRLTKTPIGYIVDTLKSSLPEYNEQHEENKE